jgi:ribosome-associated protein
LAKRSAVGTAARALAVEAARIADDNNAQDVVVLDLRGLSPVTDYFVICTGTSRPQMRAVAEKVANYGRSIGQNTYREAGVDGGQWAVLDFVDVVVHVFGPVHRQYYDLELIWGSAPKVRWRRRAAARSQ